MTKRLELARSLAVHNAVREYQPRSASDDGFSSILQVPCIVARWSTERPETVEVGGCIVCGCLPANMLEAAVEMLGRKRDWQHILGDGHSSERVVDKILTLRHRISSKRFVPPIIDERKRASFSPYINRLAGD